MKPSRLVLLAAATVVVLCPTVGAAETSPIEIEVLVDGDGDGIFSTVEVVPAGAGWEELAVVTNTGAETFFFGLEYWQWPGYPYPDTAGCLMAVWELDPGESFECRGSVRPRLPGAPSSGVQYIGYEATGYEPLAGGGEVIARAFDEARVVFPATLPRAPFDPPVQLVFDRRGDGTSDVAYFDHEGDWVVGFTFSDFYVPPWSTRLAFLFGEFFDRWPAGPFPVNVVGDFNGDGFDDLAYFRDGEWTVNTETQESSSLWASFSTKSGWSTHVVGDFNGDGLDDIANFHPRNNTWWISLSTGTGFQTRLWTRFTSSGWTTHLVGDFNGDGRDDLANFHPRNNTWWISQSTGTGFQTKLWARLSSEVWTNQLVGDFNGDGRDDIANFREDNTWWVSQSTGSGFTTEEWARFTSRGWTIHLVGDFDGDGRDDLANFHPRNNTWWISLSTGTGFQTRLWTRFTSRGWTTQLVGDFNGDGRDDIVSYHPKNESWWFNTSTGDGFVTRLAARGITE